MTRRYARMQFSSSRRETLAVRRINLPTIEEMPSGETKTDEYLNFPTKATISPAVPHLQRAFKVGPSVSDLSSVNIQQIKGRLKLPDEASTKFSKTSSIQVKQGNYPQLPGIDGGNNTMACQWCGEPLIKQKLSETDWRGEFTKESKIKDEPIVPKQQKEQQKQDTANFSNKNPERASLERHSSDLDSMLSDDSSESDNADSYQSDDGDVIDDDIKSNSADLDEMTSDASEETNLERLSHATSFVYEATKDMESESNEKIPSNLDGNAATDDAVISSKNHNFKLGLEQYDNLGVHNDADSDYIAEWLPHVTAEEEDEGTDRFYASPPANLTTLSSPNEP
ncbi:hypothetical protein ACHAPE_000570 [Trichoderma viride]